ncbi:MAG: sigma-70 family RNA polymerase sigma factor [Spirochaetes bacterium]|nr:sigma-70 family RNA polymerase sigma factor [Spirochaetota bacterium]
MTTLHDEYIIQQILKGKHDLFRIIVERYQNIIFSLGMRFFKNYDEATDFTQEIFIKVYNNLDTFKGIASFKSWLMKIGYNHAINRLNSVKNNNVEYNDSIDGCSDPEKQVIHDELQTILEEAVNSLPPEYRVCIDLYFYVGLPFKEISHITGFPVNTIKSYVYRAKQHLRQALKGTIAEDYYEM